MGCFSFMCKESGKPAASSSFDGDAVYLFLLKDGKVIEEMYGHYDSYGRVFDKNGDSFQWNMDWSDVCDLIFNGNSGDGIALVLACNYSGKVPTTQSEDDPDQGWGEPNGCGLKVSEPYHKVYGEEGKPEDKVDMYDFINEYLIQKWLAIGIDMPENHNDICQFVMEDVKETADPENWHSGDVDIAFRRFLEGK